MKKFLFNIGMYITLCIIIIFLLFIFITQISTKKFRNSYQYEINIKYDKLKKTNEPKIVVIGGSNVAFGIDNDILEMKTNKKVVNLGLHANFSPQFYTDMCKKNINKGDIIVLAYEYEYVYGGKVDNCDSELVMSGIDNNLELYQYIPKTKIKDMLKYFPTYVLKKISSLDNKEDTSRYHIDMFNSDGNMIFVTTDCTIPLVLKEEQKLKNDSFNISDECIKYINDFTKEANNKGARVFLSFPSILDEAIVADNDEIKLFEKKLEDELLPKKISTIFDYIYSRKYMFDTIYHCNTLGKKIRTEQLAQDIMNNL